MAVRDACIYILVENTVGTSGIIGEHGISFLIRTSDYTILFDTGQSDILFHNAQQMNLDLDHVKSIVISHGHYDHTGGLETALKTIPEKDLYIHPHAFQPKYSRKNKIKHRYVGIPSEITTSLVDQTVRNFYYTITPCEIARRGIYVTGEIPRETDFEDTGGAFYLDEQGEKVDPLLDDLSIFFETPKGLVLITGCCHAGIVNTMRYVSQLAGNKTFYCVMGGFHLLHAEEERRRKTLEAFREYRVQRIGIGHCTGINALVDFWTKFPGQCFTIPAGSVFQLDSLP